MAFSFLLLKTLPAPEDALPAPEDALPAPEDALPAPEDALPAPPLSSWSTGGGPPLMS